MKRAAPHPATCPEIMPTDHAPSTADPTLRIRDVSLSLAGKPVLSGIDLTLSDHRIGIVGRNGSGKTSLARLVAGLIAPSTGDIKLCGVDVCKDRKAAIKTVGILFQNPDHQIIFPTVEEELAFGLSQLGLDTSESAHQVAKTLAAFGKSHWAKAATHALSQGQKQLVCLMAIIAMKPKVVILDEPFSGLDIPTRAQLSRYFERIEAHVIHISHDPATLDTCTHAIWLEGGKIHQQGPAAATLDAFTQHMTQLGGRDDISDLTG